MSKESYLFEAGMHEERLALVAQKTRGVTIEWGARGVFEGIEGARRTMVDIENGFKKFHAQLMKKAFPEVNFPDETSGMLETSLIGTLVIEIAGDGKTARGVWMSLMAALGTEHGKEKPVAVWVWWKSAVDFVKEDGEWRIWHYLKNPLFATPYSKDWVENSLNMPPIPTPGTGKPLLSGHGGNPDRLTTKLYDPYRITRIPKLQPEPPEPYETFDMTTSYCF